MKTIEEIFKELNKKENKIKMIEKLIKEKEDDEQRTC